MVSVNYAKKSKTSSCGAKFADASYKQEHICSRELQRHGHALHCIHDAIRYSPLALAHAISIGKFSRYFLLSIASPA